MESETLTNGLSTQQAAKGLKTHGQNTIEQASQFSAFKLLITQYTNLLNAILLIAGIFAFIVHEPVDAFFILFILIMNGLFGFFQEYRAEKTLEKLKDLVQPQISVIRDGKEQLLDVADIVPEDIILLREGDKIPADGQLATSVAFEVDESIFTGESLPVEKSKGDLLMAGTFLLRGQGKMIVSATGLKTKLGQIALEMKQLKKPKTPLASNLESLSKKLAFAAIGVSLLLIPLGIWQGRVIQELILTTISLSVAVIPEGLPLVVTIALAVGAYRMTQKKTIVRKMAAVETLGTTNVILSDKTGTLTQNKMRVKKHWIPEKSSLQLLSRACVAGNSANLVLEKDGEPLDVLGDKTDGALLLFAHDNTASFDDFRAEGKVIEEKPFDPVTKVIETEWEDAKGTKRFFMRGAPESILKTISDSHKDVAGKTVEEFAKEGLRVIGLAHKKGKTKEYELIGLIGIYDAPRLEAKVAIQEAKKAGIRVVMVTGDNPVTAFAIAQEIGMFDEGEIVVTSDEIADLSDEKLMEQLPRIRVFARMKPEDKLRLVRLYKRSGLVVAVTGDGVNDSLALSEANIGVAMGKAGTDVAKEAADIIITDDNLSTIVKAVEQGRMIFANITRVVVYLVAANAAEFLTVFIGIMIGLPVPLTATQILWINLVSDGLPAMALATDTRHKNVLNQKPRDTKEQIINKTRALYMAKIAIPFSIIILAIFAALLQYFSLEQARLMIFTIFVIGELVIVYIVRGGIRPWNKLLLLSVLTSLALQVIILSNPFLRSIFS
ncbi:MAG TPA: cation-translocating P-type ATPase [Candidatus Levybacteria bacterium]|nr:cation-translocating P-type ATPase [Candidatus Levybacteria bacterium]